MRLKTLLKDLSVVVKGSKETEITGVCAHSKKVAPGNLFIAKKSEFINEAVANGAVAVVTDILDPFLQVVQVITKNFEEVEEELAGRFYKKEKKLFLIGITGTNGKTTTSYLVRHLLGSCSLIGTVEWIVGDNHLPSSHTTPDLLTNYKLFYEMVQAKSDACVMEVSSHALDQGRVRGIEYDAAIFTNLTQDHLDYHQTMEKYREAKLKLFKQCKVAIINADSSLGIAGMTYGIDNLADVRAEDIQFSTKGTQFRVKGVLFKSTLIGRFNVYNCLAAICVGLIKGFTLEEIAKKLSAFKNVRGRLESVENKKGVSVFVDYAHTEDALENVLKTLNEIKKGRLITVFGCGGDRDQGKRPKMGSVAEKLSDVVIVTSDNPRSEDPDLIIKNILSGVINLKSIIVEPDRSAAITRALKLANREDIVLIAGKGHENYQIFANRTIAFDDREVVGRTI